MNSLSSDKNIVLINIESNLLGFSKEGLPKINEVTSVFSDNCFNCLNGENLPGADYGKLTLCEGLSAFRGLKNSSSTPACENYDPYIKK